MLLSAAFIARVGGADSAKSFPSRLNGIRLLISMESYEGSSLFAVGSQDFKTVVPAKGQASDFF